MAAPREKGYGDQHGQAGYTGGTGDQSQDAIGLAILRCRLPPRRGEEFGEVEGTKNEPQPLLGDEDEDAYNEDDRRYATDKDKNLDDLVDVPVGVTAVEVAILASLCKPPAAVTCLTRDFCRRDRAAFDFGHVNRLLLPARFRSSPAIEPKLPERLPGNGHRRLLRPGRPAPRQRPNQKTRCGKADAADNR